MAFTGVEASPAQDVCRRSSQRGLRVPQTEHATGFRRAAPNAPLAVDEEQAEVEIIQVCCEKTGVCR